MHSLTLVCSQTLILGFNSLSDVSGLPWAALAALESLDLSSNRLHDLGDVVLMTWLRRLNLENNEISPVPLELGLCSGEVNGSRCGAVAYSAISARWSTSVARQNDPVSDGFNMSSVFATAPSPGLRGFGSPNLLVPDCL